MNEQTIVQAICITSSSSFYSILYNMTHVYVGHDSIYMWNMTLSDAEHDSFIFETCIISYVTSHPSMSHVCGTSYCHITSMNEYMTNKCFTVCNSIIFVGHDSFMAVKWHYTFKLHKVEKKRHAFERTSGLQCTCLWNGSFIHVTWEKYLNTDNFDRLWLIHTCDVTFSNVAHDSFVYGTWLMHAHLKCPP